MNFKRQLIETDFAPIKPGTHSLLGDGKVPDNRDVFYKAKWHELYERYESARMMLMQADTLDDCGWINNIKPEKDRNYMKLRQRTYFYESALVFYNILIDLSWVISYIAMEYVVYEIDDKGNKTSRNTNGHSTIDEAYDLLRKLEKNVFNPNDEQNPLSYFKCMTPEFSNAIVLIESFWKVFSNSEIRRKYNYVKHRGKPAYDELTSLLKPPFKISIEINGVEMPSSIFDVQETWNLTNCIKELEDFDNDILFAYLSSLVNEINTIIKPSNVII